MGLKHTFTGLCALLKLRFSADQQQWPQTTYMLSFQKAQRFGLEVMLFSLLKELKALLSNRKTMIISEGKSYAVPSYFFPSFPPPNSPLMGYFISSHIVGSEL